MSVFYRVQHCCVLLILLVVDMLRNVYRISVIVILHKFLRFEMRIELGMDEAVSPQSIPHRAQTRAPFRVKVQTLR